jgi:hypothetical protein
MVDATDDFTRSRKMGHIALEIPFGLFSIAGRSQCHNTTAPWIQGFGDALDRASFACGITPFKQNYNAGTPTGATESLSDSNYPLKPFQ